MLGYKSIRKLVHTGDLIAVRGRGFLSFLTRYFTRSPYTHTGVAIWKEDGLYMAELNSGRNHLIPLSQLSRIDFDIYAAPVSNCEDAINQWLRHQVDYGYLSFLAIGLFNWLRITTFLHWKNILVCSGYCVAIYQTAGWKENVSRVISPGELTSHLKLKVQKIW